MFSLEALELRLCEFPEQLVVWQCCPIYYAGLFGGRRRNPQNQTHLWLHLIYWGIGMLKQHRVSLLAGCAAIVVMLAVTSSARADLLAYWSANSPNDDFIVQNDFGNADYEAVFAGDANFAGDGKGVTGAAGDNAMEFFGTDEDFAEVQIPGIEYEEITIAGWLNGAQTGAWSGIFQTRDSPPIGIGYNNVSGRLTYTWNDNNANSWDFPAGSPDGDLLTIPEDQWTFVALSLTPDQATLFVGPKGEDLQAVTNDIPQLTQAPAGVGWRFGEDNCCGTERNFVGLMDDFAIWDHALLPQELAQIHSGEKIATDFTERSGGLRQVQVAGASIGTEGLAGAVSNIQKGDPTLMEGLAQYWIDGNIRGGANAVGDYQRSAKRVRKLFHSQRPDPSLLTRHGGREATFSRFAANHCPNTRMVWLVLGLADRTMRRTTV